MTTEILAQFTNQEDGVTTFVTKGAKGFHVSMQDLDSGSYYPEVIIYPELEKAIIQAKTIL